jgi:type IV fimbrial biogenesis protein FimT
MAASGHRAARTVRAGFTLIEMMVVIVLMSLLMALAMPSMMEWIRNGKVRTVGESLQNGLRLAQTEGLRRSRQVVFSLTDSKPTADSTDITAQQDGANWAIHALPSMSAGEAGQFVEAGVLTDVASGVQITGPASICFNSVGRLVPNSTSTLTGITGGSTCAVDSPPVYDIRAEGATRRLRVVVALGGQVRMCDPDKTLSATHPDGCAP